MCILTANPILMKNFNTVLLLVLWLISCNKEKSILQHSEYSFENIPDYNDTISIKPRFEDCGEWVAMSI